MRPAEWPRSILPKDRDGRWNWLLAAICCLWRALRDGERPARLFMVACGKDGERVVRYPDVTELECEEEAC